MNGNSVLVDTNIVLYLLSGDTTLSASLHNKKIYISFITQLELLGYQGITPEEQSAILAFIDECIIIDINQKIKTEVINLKKEYNLKLPDTIILATSQYLGIPLMSADKALMKVETVDLILYDKQ